MSSAVTASPPSGSPGIPGSPSPSRTTFSRKTRTHLISGFTGGLTSAVILQPFDLLKTRVQQSTDSTLRSSINELKSVKELWRGTLPSALRTSIGSSLYLTFLNSTRVYLSRLRGDIQTPKSNPKNRSSHLVQLSPQENLFTGMFSRAVIGWVTMPFTIIKVRYESNLYHYKSLREAVTSIHHNEKITGFFKGYWATAARDAPNAGLYVLFYEQCKIFIPTLLDKTSIIKPSSSSSSLKDNQDIGTQFFNSPRSAIINTSSAILSASLATFITGPFDTIKTNMQLNPQFTFVTMTKNLYKNGGPKRFFDGLGLRLIRKGCSAGIAWCLYEELVKYFG